MGPRRRRVRWGASAHRQLDEATAYVAQDSPQNAVELLERLLAAAESLHELAERGSIVPEVEDPQIRELYVRPYRLIYFVGDPVVEILGVLHERRDFDRWERAT